MEKIIPQKLIRGNKVRKMPKIRKRYNQVPHLTQDTTWESNKKTHKPWVDKHVRALQRSGTNSSRDSVLLTESVETPQTTPPPPPNHL